MRVLYISSRSFDYLQDIVFTGLVEVLGSRRVTHWPVNPKFILPIKKYPKNLGYSKNTFRTTSIRRPKLNKYDLVIVAACKPDAVGSYLEIIDSIPTKCPVVFLDGGDRVDIGGDLQRLGSEDIWNECVNKRPFDFIFKRELLKGHSHDANVFAMPFGFNFKRIPYSKPARGFKYDVSFWAVESHEVRTEALKIIGDKFDCKKNGTILNQNFKQYKRKGQLYLQELSSCKITLNFRGGGWDTLRYWEVPALGRFMVTQKPEIIIPNDFEHEKHVIHCPQDLGELPDVCKFYLKNESLREKIAVQGFDHCRKYHSSEVRAKYLLSTTSQPIKNS